MPDKRRERWYLELLRRPEPQIPRGPALEPEPPDFLLGAEGRKLGIDLTSFHLPHPPGERPYQERQSLKDHIVNRAQSIHEEAGGPALYVGIYFNERKPLTKRDIVPLARAIAESVLRAPMPRSRYEPVELQWGSRPEATWGIQIHPSVDGKDKLWHADSGGMAADISPQHVVGWAAPSSRATCGCMRGYTPSPPRSRTC